MNELIRAEQAELSTQRGLTADMYTRFVAFIDAKPKTVETYTKALKQLFAFFAANGISNPTREDVLAFRDELKATGHKPTTVQNYITATRLFFQWLEQERIYPNVAAHIKGAKLDREHKKDYLTSRQVKAVLSDYYLMSTNAITMDGELINIDGNGNRVACLIHGPKHIIIVAGMNKVVSDVEAGYARVRDIATPANTKRLNKNTPCFHTGRCGDCLSPECICNQVVITRRSGHPGRIKVFLVAEDLGY